MSDIVLKTQNLSKKFGNYKALNNVNIELRQGKIYGLIGRNGAGKTTLMRIIAGLSFCTEGTVELFGHKGRTISQNDLKRIGCLIEYPKMNGNMTAKENMKLHRIIRGIPNEEVEDELLELVGLTDTGKRKAKDFSLGMRQRLGIAIALVGSPELILLDEPVNGLDPVGVVEIRNLIKNICEKKGVTILISSHNLPELYQTASDYIIIEKGNIMKQLSLTKLDEVCSHHIAIECDDKEKLVRIIEDQLNTDKFKVMHDGSVKLYDHINDRKMVSKTLYENGIIPTKFNLECDTLENYFMTVIGGNLHD